MKDRLQMISGPNCAGEDRIAWSREMAGVRTVTVDRNGQLVGHARVGHHARGAIIVFDLHVAAAWRGLGYGRRLLASIGAFAARRNLESIVLACGDNGSGRLVDWYRSLGFVPRGMDQQGHALLSMPVASSHRL